MQLSGSRAPEVQESHAVPGTAQNGCEAPKTPKADGCGGQGTRGLDRGMVLDQRYDFERNGEMVSWLNQGVVPVATICQMRNWICNNF